MEQRFVGKTVVVTGAGGGMGRAIAERFAAEGASVAVLDVNEKAATETVDRISGSGGRAVAFTVDISDVESVNAVAERVQAEFTSVDVLINNAGILDGFADMEHTDKALWDRIIGVNLTGMYLITHAFLPMLQATGHAAIVNTASIAGLVGNAGGVAYTASKHGVIGFTQQLTVNCAPSIRVNAVLPGAVDTGMTKDLFHSSESGVADAAKAVPAGRYAQPEEIANVVVFVASEEASFMYGSQVLVDGGWTVV